MAASASAIRAGSAFVEFFTVDGQLQRGLEQIKRRLASFGKSVEAIGRGIKDAGVRALTLGGLAATPIIAAVHQFMEMGSTLAEMSTRTGAGVEALSAIVPAAARAGASAEELETGFKFMLKNLAEAAQGSASARAALAEIGLTIADLIDLPVEEQFGKIADAIAAVEDPAMRTNAVLKLMGRSGTKLLPLMLDAREDLLEAGKALDNIHGRGPSQSLALWQEKGRASGTLISPAEAEAAHQAEKAFFDFAQVIASFVFQIGNAFAPALLDLAREVQPYIVAVRDWVKEHHGLAVGITKIVVGILALGAGMVAIGFSIQLAGRALMFFSKTMNLAINLLFLLPKLLSAAFSAFSMLGSLSVLLSPLGLVLVTMGALAGYIVYSWASVSNVLREFGPQVRAAGQDAVKAWDGIRAAFEAGDLGLAAKIAWLFIKAEWIRGVNFLMDCWVDFKNFFLDVWDTASTDLAIILMQCWSGIKISWAVVCAGVQEGWIVLVGSLEVAWLAFVGAMAMAWAEARRRMGLDDEEVGQKIFENNQRKIQESMENTRSKRQKVRQGMRDDVIDIVNDEKGREEGLKANDKAKADNRRRVSQIGKDERKKNLDDALGDLNQAVDEAAKAKNKTKEDLENKINRAGPPPPEIFQGLSAAGTFTGMAVGQMGIGTSLAERTARATEETAANTRQLAAAGPGGVGAPAFTS